MGLATSRVASRAPPTAPPDRRGLRRRAARFASRHADVFLINLKEVLLSPSAAVCLTGQEGAADNPL